MKSAIWGLVCAALFLTATEAAAKQVTDTDRGAIAARIGVLEGITARGDYAGVLDVLPPGLVAAMVRDFGVSEPQLREGLRDAMQDALESVSFVSFDMDLASAETGATPDGVRHYLMIPTRTAMDIADVGRVIVRSQTLAMSEGGEWYLVRVSEPSQASFLRQVYPEFTAVDFPGSTMERVD